MFPVFVRAEFEWIPYSIDNDLFLGNDSGYTNGIYVSLYDLDRGGEQPSPSWMLRLLLWSLPVQHPAGAVNSYTIGQTMITPQGITIEAPGEEDLPYAGLLFVNNTYLSIHKQYADKIEDMKRFSEFKSKLEYYTTVDYTTSFKDLRRKVLYKYGEISGLGKEIEQLLYSLEKEKILKDK